MSKAHWQDSRTINIIKQVIACYEIQDSHDRWKAEDVINEIRNLICPH